MFGRRGHFLAPRKDASGPPDRSPLAFPVTIAEAAQQDVPIYYDALGTVSRRSIPSPSAPRSPARSSPSTFARARTSSKGDVLAKIDPAPFKAALDQAVAKKSEDEAQLIDDEKDLARFKTLVIRNAETQQDVDLQQAKVDETKATIDADQAAIEAAQTQLNYATIVAPIDGVVGFRQVDIGNIIHTNDIGPLTVLTQIKPCTVIFTLAAKRPRTGARGDAARRRSRCWPSIRTTRSNWPKASSSSSTIRSIKPPARFSSRRNFPTTTSDCGRASSCASAS